MKKFILFIMMLVIVTSSIFGCGSSAKKEGTLGSPRNEIEKIYGTGQNIKRGIVYPDRIVGFNQVGLTRSVSDKKSDIEKKDSPIYKFLPADAKEVELSKSEMPKYLKGKHKFFYSKSLADQIANSKEDGKTLKFNVSMSYTPEGEAFMEWWYDDKEMWKLFEKKAAENKANEKQNKNNTTSSNTSNSNSSSFFSSAQKVTCEQLIALQTVLGDTDRGKKPVVFENKKVEIAGEILQKSVEDGQYLVVIRRTNVSGEYYLPNGKKIYIISEYPLNCTIYLVVKDLKLYNSLKVGNAIVAKGTCHYSFNDAFFKDGPHPKLWCAIIAESIEG